LGAVDKKAKGPDARQGVASKPVPVEQYDPERKSLKKIMRAV
jgi:hypothetical protein